jgi:hypothetical protein
VWFWDVDLPLYWVIRVVLVHNFLRHVPTHGWTIPCSLKVTTITFGSLINFKNIHPLSQGKKLPTCFPFPNGSSHQSSPFVYVMNQIRSLLIPCVLSPTLSHTRDSPKSNLCIGEDKLSLGCLDMALVIPSLLFGPYFFPFYHLSLFLNTSPIHTQLHVCLLTLMF